MFTGLIEEQGRLVSLSPAGGEARLRVEASFAPELARGDSVSIDGVCVTAVELLGSIFEADVVETTLAKTTLGRMRRGERVNLERALEVGGRIGGHFVTGHVDGVGEILRVETRGAGRDLLLGIPAELGRYVAPRGSIAIDGVSLTVASFEANRVGVALIPETLTSTKAGGYRPGAAVNIEVDLLARYVESLGRGASDDRESGREGITLERLRELGFLGR